MQQKIEGLILYRIPFKEKDLISRVLLRNGQKVSILFYGGRSTRKGKAPLLELGMMNEIQLSQTKKTNELYGAKEIKNIWSHQAIRENYKAYYLLCFQLELIDKLSVECNLHQEEDYGNTLYDGNFRVLSNSLFFLEEAVKDNDFDPFVLLAMFLSKVLLEQGIFPEVNECIITGKSLSENRDDLILIQDQGGFSFKDAGLDQQEFSQQNDRTLFDFLVCSKDLPYKNYRELDKFRGQISLLKLFQYICFQLNFEQSSFKTLQVFNSF